MSGLTGADITRIELLIDLECARLKDEIPKFQRSSDLISWWKIEIKRLKETRDRLNRLTPTDLLSSRSKP